MFLTNLLHVWDRPIILDHSLNRVALKSRCARLPHITITCSLPGSTHWNTCVGLELGNVRRARTTSGALPCWGYTTVHGHVSANLEAHAAGNICRLADDVTKERVSSCSCKWTAMRKICPTRNGYFRDMLIPVDAKNRTLCTPRILRWHLMCKACSSAKSKPVVVHISLRHIRVPGQQGTLYRHSLVLRVRCDRLQTCDMRYTVLAAISILRRCSLREPSAELSWLPIGKWSSPHPPSAGHPPWWSVLADLLLCFEPWSLSTRYADQRRNRHSPCSSCLTYFTRAS